jgi:predicted nucleic acid-binding protein
VGRLRLRVYADTSVFGGCFDPPFEEASRRFFREVRAGRVVLLVSRAVSDELEGAPPRVREFMASLPSHLLAEVPITEDVRLLRDAYMAARIVGRRSMDDATHVAAATVARADAIVSWNFKHLVRLDRIRGFNRINLQLGYDFVTILNPGEAIAR